MSADARTHTSWPENGLESVPNCPVCESNTRDTLHRGLVDGIVPSTPGSWNLYRCLRCGCGYLDPRPDSDAIHLAYQEYYTHSRPIRVAADSLSRVRRLRRRLANGFRNWRFGVSLMPASNLGVIAAWLLPSQRKAIEHEFRHLPRFAVGRLLLDVGFGSGAFLDLAMAAGWRVAGVDTDPLAVELARKRGLHVRLGGVSAFADMPQSFDVITLSHVIEHSHNPRAVIREVYSLLKPGGWAWIETPNIDSAGHEFFGPYWRGLEPPRHLTLFNWQALKSMLRQEGFYRIRERVCYNVYPSLVAASKAIQNGKDPYEPSAPEFLDRVVTFWLALKTRFNYRRSEFVTLIATKPHQPKRSAQ